MSKGLSNVLITTVEGFIHLLTRMTYRKLYVRSLRIILFTVSQYLSQSGSDNVGTACDGIYESAFQQLATVTLDWR